MKWILTLLIVLYHIQLPGSAEGLAADIFMYIKNLGIASFWLLHLYQAICSFIMPIALRV